jgi:hypothetical protein
MRTRKQKPLVAHNMAELFPALSRPGESANAEALQSRLIDACEVAVRQGMSPLEALSTVLKWASSELNRIRPPSAADSH